MEISGLPRGFGTCCLRFTSGVATTHARLASGWLARLYREGVEPSGSLQKVSDHIPRPPFLDLSWRKKDLKSAGFCHDAKRNPCMLVVSWRLAMNFAREPFFAEPRRKSGSMCRSALATTNSDGGMPGRMVRSHDPNESQTSLGATTARYWSRPWATTPA